MCRLQTCDNQAAVTDQTDGEHFEDLGMENSDMDDVDDEDDDM